MGWTMLPRLLASLAILSAPFCRRTIGPMADNDLNQGLQELDRRGISAGIFFPSRVRNATPEQAIDFEIPMNDGVKLGARWHLRDPQAATLLAFHGNGETVPDYDDIADLFVSAGFNLFMVDYRGYGWSGGRPGLATLLSDPPQVAEFALREIRSRTPQAPPPSLFGRSLGSLAASHLAVDHGDAFRCLIIESGIGDVRPTMRRFGIDLGEGGEWFHDHFSNSQKLRGLKIPALILHGEQDELLPPVHARDNFAAIAHQRKQLQMFPRAGHNDMLFFANDYRQALSNFRTRYCASGDES